MIEYKSKREITLMREAGRIVALCHEALEDFLKPGVTGLEIDAFVENIILENGAIPSFKGFEGYPATTNVCINEVVVHGIPNDQALQDGDIVTVDIGACYKGFHGDSGWTYAIGNIDSEKTHLLKITEEALHKAIEVIKPGANLRQVSRTIQNHIETNGLFIVKELAGHGLGRGLHEEPMVLNYDTGIGNLILKPGLVIAVEPIVALGSGGIELLDDDWTIVTANNRSAAQFEHTIAITETGCEILTKL